jgi:Mg-chelatase subunit ChlD
MLKPIGLAVVSAIEDARVEALLAHDYPGVQRWFREALARVPLPDGLGYGAFVARLDRALLDPDHVDPNHWVNKARALFDEARSRHGLDDYAAFRRIAAVLANDLGQMRVPFDPLAPPPASYRDDHSFLWDHCEDSDDVHTLEQTASVAPPDAPAPVEAFEQRWFYPEWDARRQLMRRDWCTVIEKRAVLPRRPRPPAETATAALRRRRLARPVGRRRVRRQWEGDELDIDAVIEAAIDRRRDEPRPARVFQRRGHEDRSASVLLLLDLSASANDRTGAGTARVLDVEKEAALLLAGSAPPGVERVAIHGFASNTRAEVEYLRLLEFGAPLDEAARQLVDAVPARWSTRLGAALRHATTCLAREPADRRAIVLLTDGVPADIDVFDPAYLVEDAREAIFEARARGIESYVVVLGASAQSDSRRIFGARNVRVVDPPQTLPRHLADLCARWSAP